MKTLNVEENLWKALMVLKMDWNCGSLNEVVDKLYNYYICEVKQ